MPIRRYERQPGVLGGGDTVEFNVKTRAIHSAADCTATSSNRSTSNAFPFTLTIKRGTLGSTKEAAASQVRCEHVQSRQASPFPPHGHRSQPRNKLIPIHGVPRISTALNGPRAVWGGATHFACAANVLTPPLTPPPRDPAASAGTLCRPVHPHLHKPARQAPRGPPSWRRQASLGLNGDAVINSPGRRAEKKPASRVT
ncbi:hypothetical protein SKAU_G00170980 [Synaphobranchus kaupii]|uniref:Uncharacterized protein n=1 Tax=Synaphobranchus kaupii TaxID=118154 RepID=A0A9Q1J0C9_SYNKA|nr:hypothetical protein SKAU_G00170980 [Synaphobranchus kaupii]